MGNRSCLPQQFPLSLCWCLLLVGLALPVFGAPSDTLRAHQLRIQAEKAHGVNAELSIVYQEAAEAFQQAGASKQAAEIWLHAGDRWLDWGEAATALPYYQQCFALLHSASAASTLLLRARLGISSAALELQHYNQSKDQLEWVEANLPQNMSSRLLFAEVFRDLGICHSELNNAPKAMGYFARSRQLASGTKELEVALQVTLFIALGHHYFESRDLDLCQRNLQEAVELAERKLPQTHLVRGQAYNHLAEILSIQRQSTALDYLAKARQIWFARYGATHPFMAELHHNTGFHYECQRQFQQAIPHYQQTLQILQSLRGIGSLPQIVLLNNLGRCHRHLKQYSEANRTFSQALEMGQQLFGSNSQYVAYSHHQLAIVNRQQGQFQGALDRYQQALVSSVRGFHDLDPLVNPPLLRSSHITNVPHDLLEILKEKGGLLTQLPDSVASQKHLETALGCFEGAIRLMDTLRLQGMASVASKTALAQSLMPMFENAIATAYRLHAQSGNPAYLEQAFWFAEKSKSYLLLTAIRDADARIEAAIPSVWLEQEQALLVQLTTCEGAIKNAVKKDDINLAVSLVKLEREWLQLNQQLNQIRRELEQHFPEYYRLKYNLEPMTAASVQQELSPRHGLLEFFRGDNILYLFVLQTDSLALFRYPASPELEDNVRELRKLLSKPSSRADHFAPLSSLLYQQLISPAEEVLHRPEAPVSSLTIVPDGILGYVPFDLLLTAPVFNTSPSFQELPYWFRETDIAYQYSATLFATKRTHIGAEHAEQFIAFAPKMEAVPVAESDFSPIAERLRSEALAPLVYSSDEVAGIERFLPGTSYTGDEATETLFKKEAANYGIIHLATHALVDDEMPMFSRLVLNAGNDSTDDGFLYTHELFQLRLNADLAVLSACNTGYGKLIRGEGVMSLARGFFHAGCPSILVTRWDANDFSTSELMQGFYKGLHKGWSKDHALRQARLDYLKQSDGLKSHPFYWGGFALIGDPAPLPGLATPAPWHMGLFALIGLSSAILLFWAGRKWRIAYKSDKSFRARSV